MTTRMYRFIPVTPDDVEHVVDLLRDELSPVDGDASRRSLGLSNPNSCASLLESSLQRAWRDAGEGIGDIESMSDYLHAEQWVSPYALAVARALGVLHQVDSDAEFAAHIGRNEAGGFFEDPWKELTDSLTAVALWMSNRATQYWSEAHAQASERVRALGAAANQGVAFRSGRRRGALAPHTVYLRDLILDHPNMTTKQLARLVRDRRNDGGNPFDVDADEDIFRDSGKRINLEAAIENVRKRHVNRSDSAI